MIIKLPSADHWTATDSNPRPHASPRRSGTLRGFICAFLLLLPIGLVAACGDNADGGDAASARGVSTATIPEQAPDMTGFITLAEMNSLRVEQEPADSAGTPKAIVELSDQTEIRFRMGEAAGAADFVIGQNVSVWFENPPPDSYPTRGVARLIVIEPLI